MPTSAEDAAKFIAVDTRDTQALSVNVQALSSKAGDIMTLPSTDLGLLLLQDHLCEGTHSGYS